MDALEICNLTLRIDGKLILNDLSLAIPNGEFHVLMGKNGMGKSSLAKTIVGHPDYVISQGKHYFSRRKYYPIPSGKTSPTGHLPRLPTSRRNPRRFHCELYPQRDECTK
jgi:Fe-S cluster assembly ATP-binding protein